mmetsp:Transcript_4640/g.5337  ORF Transcript_4640/g.5337 Transcript_4640/m.5337 type:complete len:212 (-) Transcript_4640:346-981(-)
MISRSGKSPTSIFLPLTNPPYAGPGVSKYLFPLLVVPSVLPTGSSNITPTQYPPDPNSGTSPTKAIFPRLLPGRTSHLMSAAMPSTVSGPNSHSFFSSSQQPFSQLASIFSFWASSSSSTRTAVPLGPYSKPLGNSKPNLACLCASINSLCSFACFASVNVESFSFCLRPQSLKVPFLLLYSSSDMTYLLTRDVSSYAPPLDPECGSRSVQ